MRKQINEIISEINQNTLVIFDIDYTLLRSTTTLGTPEWFLYLMQQEMNKGTSLYSSFNKWYPIWMKAQCFNEVVLMDQQIPNLCAMISQMSIGYIALTARHPKTVDITNKQLAKVGLDFNNRLLMDIKFSSRLKYPTLYNKNILFSHDLNKKSTVFTEWFAQAAKQYDDKLPIKKIIFIDDMSENVTTMEHAAKKIGLEYAGIHYTAGDVYKAKLDPKLVVYQAEVLTQEYPLNTIRMLLERASV